MAIFKQIDRQIIGEIVSLTFVVIASLSTIMFLFRVLANAEYIMTSPKSFLAFVLFVVFLIPSILKLTLPLGILVAATLTSLRMSSDRETEGWLSLGVSQLRLAFPAFVTGVFFFFLSLGLSLWAEPFARNQFLQFKWMHARQSVEAIIENKLREKIILTGVFPTKTLDITLHVERVSSNKKNFEGVFLALRRSVLEKEIVLHAKTGSLDKEMDNGIMDYVFTFNEGSYNIPSGSESLIGSAEISPDQKGFSLPSLLSSSPKESDKKKSEEAVWTIVHFSKLRLSLLALFQKHLDPGSYNAEDIRSMYPQAYWKKLKEHRKSPDWGKKSSLGRDFSFFYENLVVPFSCLFLPMIGLGMGLRDPRQKPGSSYLGIGITILFFYTSIMLCQRLSMRFITPPEVCLVLPSAVIILNTLVIAHWRIVEPPGTRFWLYIKRQLLRKQEPTVESF